MIQGLMSSVPTTPEVASVQASPAVQDKGFISVLNLSVRNAGTGGGAASASVADTGAKDASTPTNALPKEVSNDIQHAAVVKDPSPANETKGNQRVQDPNEELLQLVLQMTSISPQMIHQPVPKSALATAEVVPTQGALALQSAAVPVTTDISTDRGQSSSTVQAVVDTLVVSQPALSQGANFAATLAANQSAPPNKIDLKLQDKTSPNDTTGFFSDGKDLQHGSSSGSVQGTANSAKAEAELQAFNQGGKGAALLSRTSVSSNEALSQFKIDSSAVQNVTPTPDDKSFARDASGLYAQTVQTQPASGHDQSPVQETVPASKLASLDEVISKAVDAGQKNLVIRIDPPDLGSMHIRLSLDNGVLKADVRVDSGSVKDSFNLALPQIKASLENSGIKVSEFHVDVREDQQGDRQERNNQGQQQQRQSREFNKGFFDFFA